MKACRDSADGTARILLVEDDAMIASGLIYALEQEGYAVTRAGGVRAARGALADGRFELAILDMQLPDGTGSDVREALRGTDAAVIFLTVVDDEGSIVRAFEGGADDYVTKPFRLRELLARVKRALNARGGATHSSILTLGGASIDAQAGKAYLNGAPLELTALEYRLLLTFAQNKGRLLTRAWILESIWDSSGNFVEDNTLTVYIKRLREKLGAAVNIETVRGIGYRAD
ncbi:MAG: response regulator transcription factor [Oscillospiraceae bacterium]|jgi:DNA-binding response OmpR family regulator|nr:response regulator transcription factor [Oscillospiraceae bacterium]